jgi:hypothetical protein
MSVWGESNWGGGGRKPPPVKRQAGGMAEALCIASDLGFSIPTPQVFPYFQFYPLLAFMSAVYKFTRSSQLQLVLLEVTRLDLSRK